MKVYLVNSYNIHDYETYKGYPPKVARLLIKYGAKAGKTVFIEIGVGNAQLAPLLFLF